MADWPLVGDGQTSTYYNATPDATVGGTVVQNSSGFVHTKSLYSTIAASTAYDAAGIYIDIVAGVGSIRSLIDIAVGTAGAEVVVIPNIFCPSPRALQLGFTVYFPISIPAGSRIAARLQSSTVVPSSSNVGISVRLQGVGLNPSPPRSIVQAIGILSSGQTGSTRYSGAPTANGELKAWFAEP